MQKGDSKKKLVLVIPTYNEAENIEKTINVVFNSFPQKAEWDFHILVVDGNSPDGTADIVRRLISSRSKLHLLVEKEKAGLGAAYLKALDYAYDEMNADYTMEFDADLQHDASKIKDFITKLEEGYDIVSGTRYRKDGGIPKEWKLYRKFLSRTGNIFTQLVFMQSEVTDWTSGFVVFSGKVYKKIRDKLSLEKGYTFQISTKKNAISSGFKYTEIPYFFKDREKGQSKLGPEYLFRALYFVVKTRIIEIMHSSFFKVCLVGGFGAVVQITSFNFLNKFLLVYLAHNLSIEIAVLSNFILNNLFSFNAHKINGFSNTVKKFFAFNLVSIGSIIIQNIVMFVGIFFFGTDGYREDIYNITGILLGLFSNYYFYKNHIWKVKKK